MVFMMPTIVRAQVAHTPRNPFVSEDALETFPDGALGFEDGRIVAVGVFDSVIGALGLELMEWLRSVALITRWHGRGLIRYAVSPRFSVSCSDEMLAACGEVAREAPRVLVTSHLNEAPGEIESVRSLFP